MPDLLRSASAWLQGLRTSSLAGEVTYLVGDGSPGVPVAATVGRTVEQVGGGGDDIQLEVQVRDYLINAADLAAGAVLGPPRAGHQIREADGTTFEVMPVPGEGAWRWHDPYRQTYRIHTKHVAGT